jgi:hypothetical protein
LRRILPKASCAQLNVVKQALERAGVDFIDENGGGPGVRMPKIRSTK